MIDEDFIKISAHDTGIVIRQEDIPKLFQYYGQIDKDSAFHFVLPVT